MGVQNDNEIEYVIISDTEDRIIKFGLSSPERYKDNYPRSEDPWWKVHVIVKKPDFEINRSFESMTHAELADLADKIDESAHGSTAEQRIDFMEPDYEFIISSIHGELVIYIQYTDSVHIWLEREDLENISVYIRRKLNDAMNK